MKRQRFKMIFDILLCALFILLMSTKTTGIFLHELLGILLFGLFILHKVINGRWIRKVSAGLFRKETNMKTRVKYATDVLLLISVTLLILSGVFISESLFTFIQVGDLDFWRQMHRFTAYWSLVIIAVHIGLHWPGIMAMCAKALRLKRKNTARNVALRVLAVAIAVWGVKCSVDVNLMGALFTPFGSAGKSAYEIPGTYGDGTSTAVPTMYTEGTQVSYTLSNTGSGLQVVSSAKDTAQVKTLSAAQTDSGSQSLEDYLSRLYCTGCGRHCSLLAPQCGTGVEQAALAQQQYNDNEAAGDENTSDSTTNNDTSGSTADENTTNGTTDGGGAVESRDPGTDQGGWSGGAGENGTQFERPERGGYHGGLGNGSGELSEKDGGGTFLSTMGVLGEYLSILGLFIAITHYTAKFLKRKRKVPQSASEDEPKGIL